MSRTVLQAIMWNGLWMYTHFAYFLCIEFVCFPIIGLRRYNLQLSKNNCLFPVVQIYAEKSSSQTCLKNVSLANEKENKHNCIKLLNLKFSRCFLSICLIASFFSFLLLCAPHVQAFNVVFQSAVLKAAPDETLKQRVLNLIDNITSSVFQYTTRGLFECDKLTYTAQLAFQVCCYFIRSNGWQAIVIKTVTYALSLLVSLKRWYSSPFRSCLWIKRSIQVSWTSF